MSADDGGRAQRKTVERLQARLKEANADLALAQSEGYVEALEALKDEAADAAAAAQAAEREVAKNARLLARLQHDVAEDERNRLAPPAVYKVSPAVAALTFLGMVGSVFLVGELVSVPLTPTRQGILAAMVLLPPPVLAWVVRRRFSGVSPSKARAPR